jgi:hypothetical protein
MRDARVGSLRLGFAIGAAFTFAAAATAPADARDPAPAPQSFSVSAPAPRSFSVSRPAPRSFSVSRPAPQSFSVTISPGYATAGQSTTFQVTVANTSSDATRLGSVKVTPPAGFTPPQPTPWTPLRGKTTVQNRTLSLRGLTLKPGGTVRLSITATAPTKCGGRSVLQWSARAFQGKTGSGPRLALQSAASSQGVKILCPASAACGDGGPPCSTSLVTLDSTYAVVSDARSGTLRQTVNVGGRLVCGSYRFRDPNWYDSVVVPPASQTPTAAPTPIIDQVTYKIRNAKASGVGFCLGAAYDFTTASGRQAPAGTLPNGNPGFIGLLPRCSESKPPCIASVSQKRDAATKTGFDALLKIQIPETGDPWGGA